MSKFTLESDFYCCRCGCKGIPIVRKTGKGRSAGHLKKLFCLNCKQEWNHAECKEFTHYSYEDFKLEFENGNFNEEGNRVMPYGEFRTVMNNIGALP